MQDSAQLHTVIQKLVEAFRTLHTQKQVAEHRVTEAMQALVTCAHSNMQNVQIGIAAAQSAMSCRVITPAQPPAGSFQGWTMTAHRVQGSHLSLIPDPAADTTLFLPDDALSLIGFDDTYPAVDMQQYKTKVMLILRSIISTPHS